MENVKIFKVLKKDEQKRYYLWLDTGEIRWNRTPPPVKKFFSLKLEEIHSIITQTTELTINSKNKSLSFEFYSLNKQEKFLEIFHDEDMPISEEECENIKQRTEIPFLQIETMKKKQIGSFDILNNISEFFQLKEAEIQNLPEKLDQFLLTEEKQIENKKNTVEKLLKEYRHLVLTNSIYSKELDTLHSQNTVLRSELKKYSKELNFETSKKPHLKKDPFHLSESGALVKYQHKGQIEEKLYTVSSNLEKILLWNAEGFKTGHIELWFSKIKCLSSLPENKTELKNHILISYESSNSPHFIGFLQFGSELLQELLEIYNFYCDGFKTDFQTHLEESFYQVEACKKAAQVYRESLIKSLADIENFKKVNQSLYEAELHSLLSLKPEKDIELSERAQEYFNEERSRLVQELFSLNSPRIYSEPNLK